MIANSLICWWWYCYRIECESRMVERFMMFRSLKYRQKYRHTVFAALTSLNRRYSPPAVKQAPMIPDALLAVQPAPVRLPPCSAHDAPPSGVLAEPSSAAFASVILSSMKLSNSVER